MCGQSNRPMLNGGLSPLRCDRKTRTVADLRIQSTGAAAANFINNYPDGDRKTAILRSLPPKVSQVGDYIFTCGEAQQVKERGVSSTKRVVKLKIGPN